MCAGYKNYCFWKLGFYVVLRERERERERENCTATLCIFSLRIVKFLQLRRHKQIAESRKYCLMCNYFSLVYIFFSIFVSHKFGNFVVIPIILFFQCKQEVCLKTHWLLISSATHVSMDVITLCVVV